MIEKKKIIIILLLSVISLSINFLSQTRADEYTKSDVYYLFYGKSITLELQAYEVFSSQVFWAKSIIKMTQNYGANTFNATIGLPFNFTLVDDTYDHPNQPINETTNYQWMTNWTVNSSDALPDDYTINVTENLFFMNASKKITVNPGPTLPYIVTVTTDKSSYTVGEVGNVFVYIKDNNNYSFNIDGVCNSTIFYPDGTLTSFNNVPMTYVLGSKGEYISRGFQAWGIVGIYTVEVNCSIPDGYASNTFDISTVTTTVPTTAPPGPGPGPSPGPGPAPTRISNFTIDKDLIRVELKQGETDKQSIILSNTGRTKLEITGRIQYLDEFLFFTGTRTEHTFELDPDKTEVLELNFIVKKDQEPGIYPGKIVFTGDSLERTVLVVVEVESEEPLFDVKVEVPPQYKEVFPGEEVLAEMTIYNLGRIGRVDVNLEYGIKDLEGNILGSKHETLAVETSVSIIRNLDIPATMEPDNYVFYGKVNYNDIVGTGSSMFRVIQKRKIGMNLIFLILIILALIVLIILIIYNLKKRKRKRKLKKILKKKKKRKK